MMSLRASRNLVLTDGSDTDEGKMKISSPQDFAVPSNPPHKILKLPLPCIHLQQADTINDVRDNAEPPVSQASGLYAEPLQDWSHERFDGADQKDAAYASHGFWSHEQPQDHGHHDYLQR